MKIKSSNYNENYVDLIKTIVVRPKVANVYYILLKDNYFLIYIANYIKIK